MEVTASPPPALNLPAVSSETEDYEIAQVRAEIHALTQRRGLLTSSLLSSTRVHTRLQERQTNTAALEGAQDDLSVLLASSKQIGSSNSYRLALGVTGFPFTDPSPEYQAFNPLLGIRFDICDRSGRFPKQYHLFCRRVSPSSQELRIHRHTIPSLVPLSDYEKQYLPLPDEGYGGSEDSYLSNSDPPRSQDLHALVGRVRKDLVSWRLRLDSIDDLREFLELPSPKVEGGTSDAVADEGQIDEDEDEDQDQDMSDSEFESCGKYGVRQMETCSPDASQARIVWSDGRVGRIKISPEGHIVKAAIFTGAGRVAEQERILSSDSAAIYDFRENLQRLHRTLQERHGEEVD